VSGIESSQLDGTILPLEASCLINGLFWAVDAMAAVRDPLVRDPDSRYYQNPCRPQNLAEERKKLRLSIRTAGPGLFRVEEKVCNVWRVPKLLPRGCRLTSSKQELFSTPGKSSSCLPLLLPVFGNPSWPTALELSCSRSPNMWTLASHSSGVWRPQTVTPFGPLLRSLADLETSSLGIYHCLQSDLLEVSDVRLDKVCLLTGPSIAARSGI
jgi:hypothetical protein